MRETGNRPYLLPLAVTALLLVQCYVLYAPDAPGPPSPIPHSDKLIHAAVFAAPVLVAGIARRPWWGVVALVAAVHAPVSEVMQHLLLPSRSGDVWDVVADLVGVITAVAGVSWWIRRPRRRRL